MALLVHASVATVRELWKSQKLGLEEAGSGSQIEETGVGNDLEGF
jgi:hypothetical protein